MLVTQGTAGSYVDPVQLLIPRRLQVQLETLTDARLSTADRGTPVGWTDPVLQRLETVAADDRLLGALRAATTEPIVALWLPAHQVDPDEWGDATIRLLSKLRRRPSRPRHRHRQPGPMVEVPVGDLTTFADLVVTHPEFIEPSPEKLVADDLTAKTVRDIVETVLPERTDGMV